MVANSPFSSPVPHSAADAGDDLKRSTRPRRLASQLLDDRTGLLWARQPPPSVAVWEDDYAKLGSHKHFTARAAARDALSMTGRGGARWLVDRIHDEVHSELLIDVATVLANIGEDAYVPILGGLRTDPPLDQASTLLKAIGWMDAPPTSATLRQQLQDIARNAVNSVEPELREAAGSAIAVLFPGKAKAILTDRVAVEPDAVVRDYLIDVLRHDVK
jgi:hypothetical protein